MRQIINYYNRDIYGSDYHSRILLTEDNLKNRNMNLELQIDSKCK